MFEGGGHRNKELNEQNAIESYRDKFKEKNFDYNNVPLFETIQIETFNRCNGVCSFCPVNKNVDTRKPFKMSDELYSVIIDQLHEMDYSGRIALFSNNEPLLDIKLASRAEIAKKRCPKAFIYIYTNGTLLNEKKFYELIPWLDQIIIDNYNDRLKINDNLKPINAICKNNQVLDKKVQIHLRKANEILYSRGGQAPNVKEFKIRSYPCFLPFNQMVIRPDGKVSLCCNDALGKMTLGDASKEKLTDIWYSDEYTRIRKVVIENIDELALCKYCDSRHQN